MKAAEQHESAASAAGSQASPAYQTGFGNQFASEALAGALPVGRNSPQRAPLGLYAELLSGTAFTAPRHQNGRTWMYRIRPSAAHQPFRRIDDGAWRTAPHADGAATPEPSPNRMRWAPFDISSEPRDFVEGMHTLAVNGEAGAQAGIGVHVYLANRSMERRVLMNTDGEMLLVPQQGRLRLVTELGVLLAAPGEVAVVPRGMRFRVELPDGPSRGYVCENHGAAFRLPELGPIGSNGLANPRDFLAPVAAFEDSAAPHEIVNKFAGHLWAAETDRSPLDVVAWHGNLVPYKYDTARFMAIGTISFDHPDPSIFTVLSSASDTPGTANADFVIFPPRWLVGEDTFRPPWYHRNVMSEFMGLVHGQYDAKPEGFVPGGASLHNCMAAHGPDTEAFERASAAQLAPHKLENTLAFMFETRYLLRPTAFAMNSPALQPEYWRCWQDLRIHFQGKR